MASLSLGIMAKQFVIGIIITLLSILVQICKLIIVTATNISCLLQLLLEKHECRCSESCRKLQKESNPERVTLREESHPVSVHDSSRLDDKEKVVFSAEPSKYHDETKGNSSSTEESSLTKESSSTGEDLPFEPQPATTTPSTGTLHSTEPPISPPINSCSVQPFSNQAHSSESDEASTPDVEQCIDDQPPNEDPSPDVDDPDDVEPVEEISPSQDNSLPVTSIEETSPSQESSDIICTPPAVFKPTSPTGKLVFTVVSSPNPGTQLIPNAYYITASIEETCPSQGKSDCICSSTTLCKIASSTEEVVCGQSKPNCEMPSTNTSFLSTQQSFPVMGAIETSDGEEPDRENDVLGSKEGASVDSSAVSQVPSLSSDDNSCPDAEQTTTSPIERQPRSESNQQARAIDDGQMVTSESDDNNDSSLEHPSLDSALGSSIQSSASSLDPTSSDQQEDQMPHTNTVLDSSPIKRKRKNKKKTSG